MTKTYTVTAENTVDRIEMEISAKNKKEALSAARKKLHRDEFLSRYDGPVKWQVDAGEPRA